MSSLPSPNPFEVKRLNNSQDYMPEWDVLSLNEKVSGWLAGTIRGLKGRDRPDPGLVIPVLLSPSGYGKTHLFGRIAHQLNYEALFVFVPQVEDVHKPLDHIRWHAVESLFQSRPGEPTVLARTLAGICQPSFAAYFDALQASVAARHQALHRQLQQSPDAVLQIVRGVRELGPFMRLADSMAKQFPDVRGEVVRALVLGWSPEAVIARRWLRGESVAENDLERLQLPEDPPEAGQVLHAVASLLRFQMPLVLCCDQLESVLVNIDDGPMQLSTALVGLLQSVPNQLVIMSCLEDKWDEVLDHGHQSFQRRVKVFKLDVLREDQGVELVRRRLKHWPGQRQECGETWPIREAAIRNVVVKEHPHAGSLIQACKEAMELWLDEGSGQWIESLNGEKRPDDLAGLFLQHWQKELEAIGTDSARAAAAQEESRLIRAVKETLQLVKKAGLASGSAQLEEVRELKLKWTRQKKSMEQTVLGLKLTAGSQGAKVLIALTKIENGTEFLSYFSNLQRLATDAVGTLLIHPGNDLRMGAATQEKFEAQQAAGKLRRFSLVEHSESYAAQECFLSILDKARSKEFQLDGLTLSESDLYDLTIKTAVMENLDLCAAALSWGRRPTAGARTEISPEGESVTVAARPGPATASAGSKAPIPPPRPATGGGIATAAPAALPAVVADPVEVWAAERLDKLVQVLKLFSLPVTKEGVEVGPTFARLKVRPAGKTSVNRVRNKAEDLKIHLELKFRPLIGAQAGHISVDVQLPQRKVVSMDEVMAQVPPGRDGQPLVPVGLDVSGKAHWLNLGDPSDCHLLVAGTTGSGKSEFLKAILAALSRRLTAHQVQFVLIDPKQVTFNFQGESPYLRHAIAYAVDDALPLIKECFEETERRYALLKEKHLENVAQLQGAEALPRIVMILDEFADLMTDKEARAELEKPLKRIGAKSRAAGIHLVLATQRPEASVVTPLLRSNLPGRVGFTVASEADSKLILGLPDAAHLLMRGDLLWKQGGGFQRLQCPLVGRDELERDLRLV
jgi:phosphoglycolate phosphatase-like HAD superfamily hydrolase